MKLGEKLGADVLLSPPPEALTWQAKDFLVAIPGVGVVKAGKWLAMVRISPTKTLGGMTGRQRGELSVHVCAHAARCHGREA